VRSFWLVARHEYRKRVRQRSFLLASVGIAAMIVAVMGVSILVALSQENRATTVGYVDQSGLLSANGGADRTSGGNDLVPYADTQQARAALEQREIGAYYVLGPEYPQTREVALYYWDEPPGPASQRALARLVRSSVAAGLPEEARTRLVEGPQVSLRSFDGARETRAGNVAGLIVPFVVTFFFVFVAITSASYMLQVISDEKENRMIEILVTSLTPEQIIGGKALGLMGVALTQMVIWLVATMLALLIGGQFVDILRDASLPWEGLLVSAIFFFPAYALIAGIMTTIGSAAADSRQAQQVAGLLNLWFVLPLFFAALIFADPNNPLTVALTLFPTTSFVTVSLRWGLTVIPLWQLLVAWGLLCSSAVLSVWAAARVFRAGMLHYGQPLSLRTVLAALGLGAH
jgi:ABC-2 type transport system permease protein